MYFKRREAWEYVEELAIAGTDGFFPSLTQTVLNIDVADNIHILEELVELGVLSRQFLQVEGELAIEVDVDSINEKTEDITYIKYMFTDIFVEELKSRQ